MSWSVRVWDTLNDALLVEAENGVRVVDGEAVVVIRGFDPPIVTPPGSSRVLNLFARRDLFDVPPRAIVQFSVSDTPVFWGPAVVVPPITSPGAGPFDQDRDALERITVVGGEQLLRDSGVNDLLIEGDLDVATIAFQFCSLYAHPALTVAEVNFPECGAVLNAFYKPESSLYDALQTLVDSVPGGATAWVDASGVVHFEALEVGS